MQDTTEIDLTRPAQQVEGAGPLDGARRGALLHVLHAFTPNGTALGTLHAAPRVRSDDSPTNATKSRAERYQIPIEEKESYRWLVALRQAQKEARQPVHTRFVTVADSESDIYEVLAQATLGPANCHWIVRAGQDRALDPGSGSETASAGDVQRSEPEVLPGGSCGTRWFRIRNLHCTQRSTVATSNSNGTAPCSRVTAQRFCSRPSIIITTSASPDGKSVASRSWTKSGPI